MSAWEVVVVVADQQVNQLVDDQVFEATRVALPAPRFSQMRRAVGCTSPTWSSSS